MTEIYTEKTLIWIWILCVTNSSKIFGTKKQEIFHLARYQKILCCAKVVGYSHTWLQRALDPAAHTHTGYLQKFP